MKSLGVGVFAVCTDNETKMAKLRQIISDTYKITVIYGCSALDEMTNHGILKHVTVVQKFCIFLLYLYIYITAILNVI